MKEFHGVNLLIGVVECPRLLRTWVKTPPKKANGAPPCPFTAA